MHLGTQNQLISNIRVYMISQKCKHNEKNVSTFTFFLHIDFSNCKLFLISPLTFYTKFTPLLSGAGKKCRFVALSFTLFSHIFYICASYTPFFPVEKYVNATHLFSRHHTHSIKCI